MVESTGSDAGPRHVDEQHGGDESREPSPPSSVGRSRSEIADGVERALDPAWVVTNRISSAIASASIALPLVIGSLLGGWFVSEAPAFVRVVGFAVVLVVLGVLGWSAVALPALRYRHLRYRLDAQGLAIRRGVWWRSESWVPRSRIQHTDVTQGPIERAFGLATLVMFTAGTEHARVSLEGLPESRARAIRDHLVAGEDDDGV